MTTRIRTLAATSAMIAATTAVLAVASPAAVAHVGAPARLHPGSVVYVQISGYPPGSRVRVQLATRCSLHSNCCASLTYPRVLVDQSGSKRGRHQDCN
jgi:hypothetical protein